MKSTASSLRLYYETIRRLHPEQVRFQVQRRLLGWRRAPSVDVPQPLRQRALWGPRTARCRLPFAGDVLHGEFRVWGQTRRLDLRQPWTDEALGDSWSYPVQYCEYLGACADRAREDSELATAIASFLEAWIDAHPPGTETAWDPYPTALRIVSWFDVLHTLGPQVSGASRARILASLYVQARWLNRNLERHLLGTHLLKDLKALLVAGASFDDARARAWHRRALGLLQRELGTQVDVDGAHAEPAPMYHCVALEDVLDLLNFEGALDPAAARLVQGVAARMLRYARDIQTPDGGFPLFGDGWEGGAPATRALLDYATRLGMVLDEAPQPASAARQGMVFYARSGVAVWRQPAFYVAADVGGMGTPHLSAHGHCDSLSFELWMDGAPWIVDSGTWSYAPGPVRQACRSTRAHNTLEIDGKEQHEIWGAFRVGRRSTVHAERLSPQVVEATLVPWFERSLRVRRRFEVGDACLKLHDHVEGSRNHTVRSRFHLHPDCAVERDGERLAVCRGTGVLVLEFTPGTRYEIHPAGTSAGGHARVAGEVQPNAVVVATHDGALPFTCTTTLRKAR